MKFYLDTSTFGGYFDDKFRKDTVKLFDYIIENNFKIIYSVITRNELNRAPERVRDLPKILPNVEYIEIDNEILSLAELYIKEGALAEKSFNDAQHIATATVRGASAVVSWNFKHMVNFLKIRQYNAINLREGYRMINIHTPTEMISNLEED